MYNPFDIFLLRTPYFPISTLSDFDKKQKDFFLKKMLFVASPDLSKNLNHPKVKMQNSTYRYFQRACTRPTPFGLFAGCSIGKIGGKFTDVQLAQYNTYQRTTRLNVELVSAFTRVLEKDHMIRMQLRYFSNNSIYSVGNYYRYFYYYSENTRKVHQFEKSEYIQKILVSAKKGKLIPELIGELADENITEVEANDFIQELIDEQILVSELALTATNTQPLGRLISMLKKLNGVNNEFINILYYIDSQLYDIDHHSDEKPTDKFFNVVASINEKYAKIENKYLFQTDLFKPTIKANVSHNIVRTIQKTLIFINKITPQEEHLNLEQFKKDFIKRYEYQEMPLLFVLDNEIGIGYGNNLSTDINPLVKDLTILPRDSFPNKQIHSMILQKFQRSSQKVIELTDEDVQGIEAEWKDLPPTLSVVCEILQDDTNGQLCHIKSIMGPSATSWLGRFCYLDKSIFNYTLSIAEKEAQMYPDVIFAEIVHLPVSYAKNALLRPVLRPYEIPYLSNASVSSEFIIDPSDLYVSIKGDRIILRSKRLNKEIIPRISNAHNYNGLKSMPVYHFLCDLQHQYGRTSLEFNWDAEIKKLDYLPRIIYRNCILARARWRIYKKEITTLVSINDDNDLLKCIRKWRENREIPDHVLLSDGDNELYIDMNNALSIRSWLSIVRNRDYFNLVEFLFNPKTAVVHSQEGTFVNEFIFSFYQDPNNL